MEKKIVQNKLPIALQLFTVRDETSKNFIHTLQAVADMGYSGVEFFNYGDIPAKELRKVLEDIGLCAVNTHVSISRFEYDLNKELDYASELDVRDVTLPRIPEDRRKNIKDYFNFAETLNEIGAKCKERGIRFHFHNHYYEFDKFDEITGMDIIISNTNKDNVYIELDTFWVEFAGVDSIAYLQENKDRIRMIHLKDMIKEQDPPFAEIGNGTLNIKGILNACKESLVEWIVVEQDRCLRPQLESAKISIENLKNMMDLS